MCEVTSRDLGRYVAAAPVVVLACDRPSFHSRRYWVDVSGAPLLADRAARARAVGGHLDGALAIIDHLSIVLLKTSGVLPWRTTIMWHCSSRAWPPGTRGVIRTQTSARTSPTRTSPTRTSPTRTSPTRTSPTRTSAR